MTTATLNYSTRIRDKLPQHLDKVDKQAKKTDKSLKRISKTTETIGKKTRTKVITKDIQSMGKAADTWNKSVSGFTVGLVGAFAAGTALFSLMRRSDAFVNMSNKLKLITQDSADLANTQQRLIDLSITTRTDLDALVTTYQRVDKALARMGSSAEDTAGVTEALALGIKTTGIASDEATNALRQITQAFNKGKLDGDEFRSVGENMPVVLDAIAKEANISRGELMKWARQGKITSDLMQRGLLKALPQLREDFKKIEPTFADTITAMSSAWTDLVGAMTSSQTSLGKFFGWMKRTLASITDLIQGLAKDYRDIAKGAAAREMIPIQERILKDRDMIEKVRSQKNLTQADQDFISDLEKNIKRDQERLDALKQTYYGAGSRQGRDVLQHTKGEQELGALEKRWNFLKSQRESKTISEEQFQTEGRALQRRAQALPLSENFAAAYNLDQREVPKEATSKQRQAILKANEEDLRASKHTREGFAELTGEMKKMIIPLKKTKEATKETAKELTEREKFENKTIEAMADVNKEMVVINTQRKLGLIDDQQAAQALVTLGQRKKQIKAEYLAEIATNDKLKPSLTKLNEEFDKMGKKVDPAVKGAQEAVARQTVIDMYEKQLEQQREDDRRKAESLSAARTSAAIGLGKQASTGLITEVGKQFATYEEGGVEMKDGGTAIASLNAGIEKFIETGDPLQAIFAALGPVIQDVIKALVPLLDVFTKGFGKLIKAFNKLIPIIAQALAPVLNALSPLLEALAVVFEAIGVTVKALSPILEHVVAPVLKFVSIVIRGIVDALAAVFNTVIDFINLFRVNNLEHVKTSSELESAVLKPPEEEAEDKKVQNQQLAEQRRLREIAERQLAEQKRQAAIAEKQLQAQLMAERAAHDLELRLQRQANRSAVNTQERVRFSSLPNQPNAGAPNIRIVNVNDPQAVEAQLHTDANEQAVMNFLRVNAPEVSEYVVQ